MVAGERILARIVRVELDNTVTVRLCSPSRHGPVGALCVMWLHDLPFRTRVALEGFEQVMLKSTGLVTRKGLLPALLAVYCKYIDTELSAETVYDNGTVTTWRLYAPDSEQSLNDEVLQLTHNRTRYVVERARRGDVHGRPAILAKHHVNADDGTVSAMLFPMLMPEEILAAPTDEPMRIPVLMTVIDATDSRKQLETLEAHKRAPVYFSFTGNSRAPVRIDFERGPLDARPTAAAAAAVQTQDAVNVRAQPQAPAPVLPSSTQIVANMQPQRDRLARLERRSNELMLELEQVSDEIAAVWAEVFGSK